jgi:uncharacterized protein YciI
MRIVHYYSMKLQPNRVRVLAPEHAAYWAGLGLRAYLGGPFADRSGGLITFEADSVQEAERVVAEDPFVRADLLEASVVKEWVPE